MERENLAPRGPGCVLSDGPGGGWWLRSVGEGQPEVVGATSRLARKGTWLTVKLQIPLSFSLRP